MIIRSNNFPLMAQYSEDRKTAYFNTGYYLTTKADALKMIEALTNFYNEVSAEEIDKENERLAKELKNF